MAMTQSQLESLAGEMLKTYEAAETKMVGIISSQASKGLVKPGWAMNKMQETSRVRIKLKHEMEDLKFDRNSRLNTAITNSYKSGQQSVIKQVREVFGSVNIKRFSPNSMKVATILAETKSMLNTADNVILRKAGDAYNQIIGQVAANVATGTITVREATKQAVNEFAKNGITSFVDKNGRNWQMATYAEMATVTSIQRATLEGYKDTMQEYGLDLGIISSHWSSCPLCYAWEGVIVSMSGRDATYPSIALAEEAGVFHPYCLHHVSAYYPGITKGGRSSPRPIEKPSVGYTERTKQRYMERQIREWKRRMVGSIDAADERNAYDHVRGWQAALRQHLDSATDYLPRKYYREGGAARLSKQHLIPRMTPLPALTPEQRYSQLMSVAKRYKGSTDDYNSLLIGSSKVWNNIERIQQYSLVKYTGSGYRPMNSLLRDPTMVVTNRGEITQYIDNIANALEKSSLPETVLVHRGISANDGIAKWLGGKNELSLSDASFLRSIKGQDLVEPGFMSTSVLESGAFKGVNMDIVLPKGSKAIFAEPFSQYNNVGSAWDGAPELTGKWTTEAEIIVQKGSTFRIIDYEINDQGVLKTLKMLLVDQEQEMRFTIM